MLHSLLSFSVYRIMRWCLNLPPKGSMRLFSRIMNTRIFTVLQSLLFFDVRVVPHWGPSGWLLCPFSIPTSDFESFLTFGTTRCSRLRLYFTYPGPGISPGEEVFRDHSLGSWETTPLRNGQHLPLYSDTPLTAPFISGMFHLPAYWTSTSYICHFFWLPNKNQHYEGLVLFMAVPLGLAYRRCLINICWISEWGMEGSGPLPPLAWRVLKRGLPPSLRFLSYLHQHSLAHLKKGPGGRD